MAVTGISSIGVTFGYGIETTAGTKPTAFTKLTRINSIGEMAIDYEAIDSSALEDEITQNIQGRGTATDTLEVVVNLTPDTVSEWKKLISIYDTYNSEGYDMWWQIVIPDLGGSYFIIAAPPTTIPMPAQEQNSLETVTMNLVVNSYEGLDETVEMS